MRSGSISVRAFNTRRTYNGIVCVRSFCFTYHTCLALIFYKLESSIAKAILSQIGKWHITVGLTSLAFEILARHTRALESAFRIT